jgi:hypothetical protein
MAERAEDPYRIRPVAESGPGPVALSPEYLTEVRAIEDAPANQDGTDKTWVYRAMEDDRRYFARVRRA